MNRSQISNQKFNFRLFVLTICLSALAIFMGIIFNTKHGHARSVESDYLSATILEVPKSIKHFNLVDKNGTSFTNKNLNGHWTLMFFGFTNCPYICPTTMTELTEAYKKLKTLKKPNVPMILMVSVDPERDNPSRIKDYVNSFNKSFNALTGDKKELLSLASSMSVSFSKVSPDSSSSKNQYNVDHSATILLVNPEGNLQAYFSMPHLAGDIVNNFKFITSKYS